MLTVRRGLFAGLVPRGVGRHEGVTTCNFACASETDRWALWVSMVDKLLEPGLWFEVRELLFDVIGFTTFWGGTLVDWETLLTTGLLQIFFSVCELFSGTWWELSRKCLELWTIFVNFSAFREIPSSLLDELNVLFETVTEFLSLLNSLEKLYFSAFSQFSLCRSVRVTELSFEEFQSPVLALSVRKVSDKKSKPSENVGRSFSSITTSSSVISIATTISFMSWSWKMFLPGVFLEGKINFTKRPRTSVN